MKKSKLFLSAAALILLVASAFAQPAARAEAASLKIAHAKNFNIQYMSDDVKVVTDSEGKKLLLLPEGAAVPESLRKMAVVRTPIKRGVFISTTYVGFLSKFNRESLYDSVAGVCTPVADWTLPQVVKRMKDGRIKYIEGGQMQAPNIEQLIELRPDIVFSIGGEIVGGKMIAQLDEAKITNAVVSEYTENGAEALLEWLKFFGAFYNLDEEAARIYEQTMARITDISKRAAQNRGRPPVVALGLLFKGRVYTQGGDSSFCRTIEKAGGTYALKNLKGQGSVQIGMEEFFEKCRNADILIYSSSRRYTPDKKSLLAQERLFSEFKAVKNGRVYVYGDGYYMNAAAVDEKFEDLVSIINPRAVSPQYKLRHFDQLK